MNEVVVMLAILYEKGLITKSEAVSIRNMCTKEVISSSLEEMDKKVRLALEEAHKAKVSNVDEIDARDLLKRNKKLVA